MPNCRFYSNCKDADRRKIVTQFWQDMYDAKIDNDKPGKQGFVMKRLKKRMYVCHYQ